jgi:Ni,Fe-hydrogenase maturation factor
MYLQWSKASNNTVENPKNIKIVILGIGNILLGDEGVGVHTVKVLQKEKLPSDILIIDGSTAGFRLFSIFDEYKNSRFIIIDAVRIEKPPKKTPQSKKKKTSYNEGLYVIPLDDLYQTGGLNNPGEGFISFHQTSLVDVLILFYLAYKVKIRGYLIGIDISESIDSSLSFSMILSRKIKQKIPGVIKLIKEHINP